jgi:hypothetical protein
MKLTGNSKVLVGSTLVICGGLLDLVSASRFKESNPGTIDIFIGVQLIVGGCFLIMGALEACAKKRNDSSDGLVRKA